MRILPVIDLMNGVVVRGVAGRREQYRPLLGPLCPNAGPAELARAYIDRFGLEDVYVADLDAIAGGRPNRALYAEMIHSGARLMIDAGLRDFETAQAVGSQLGVVDLVAGLETLPGPDLLAALVTSAANRVVFSLDLRDGRPLGDLRGWRSPTALGIAEQAVELGVRRLLVLDLARVGVGAGTGTEALCSSLVEAFPRVQVLAGGGVRSRDDLLRLRDLGVAGVLVSSALHDGRLTRADLAGL